MNLDSAVPPNGLSGVVNSAIVQPAAGINYDIFNHMLMKKPPVDVDVDMVVVDVDVDVDSDIKQVDVEVKLAVEVDKEKAGSTNGMADGDEAEEKEAGAPENTFHEPLEKEPLE